MDDLEQPRLPALGDLVVPLLLLPAPVALPHGQVLHHQRLAVLVGAVELHLEALLLFYREIGGGVASMRWGKGRRKRWMRRWRK